MYTSIWVLVLYSMFLVSVMSYQPFSDAVISLWRLLISIVHKSTALVAMVGYCSLY